MSVRRTLLPLGATGAAAGLLALGLAAPASAHVGITPNTTAAGAYAVLTVSVPHGCDGAATTKVAIAMPEEIPSVTPTRNPLYTVKKVIEKLDEPITDAHGNELTERVAQVVYTAKTPLPEGYRDTFELSVKLPDAEGETMVFPTVQTCVKGETGWTEVPAEGQDAEELAHPAPAITLTEGTGDGHSHGDTDDTDDTDEHADEHADEAEESAEAAGSDEGSDGTGLAVAGLVAGLLGLVAGGAALVRSGRRA
ncbi:YcnI family protein [Nocardioides sp. YIM 152588]|uniref:YcnI family copper-binding membrane protein n=1 Tax=Nocardioides sp. YIM 152588 TaxID=3158259 RepID=UPI0032E3881A